MEQMIYLLATVFFLSTVILYKKFERRISFIQNIGIIAIVYLCYNSLLCYMLNLICIPITLINLGIVNFILGAILLVFIVKKKNIQKFRFDKRELIATFLIFVVTVFVTYLNFGKELNIKYIMTDPANHYRAAREFYENDKLLNKTEQTTTSKEFMIGAYTNTGILFKFFSPIIGEMNLYKVFIVFDIFMYFMVGLIMYISIKKYIKNYISYLLSIVCIIVFMLGYPLNTLIYGYVYLQLGILIIGTIINLLQNNYEMVNRKFTLIMLFILNFALLFSYCIFVPVVYIAEGLYFLISEYRKKKKAFSLKNIIKICIVLLIPSIMGLFYIVFPHLMNNNENEVFISVEGYIYRNLWSNFVLILPGALMYLYNKNIKNKLFYCILFATLIIFMAFFFLVTYKLEISTYYYYKFNFILWFILWYGTISALNFYDKYTKIKYLMYIYCLIYALLIIFIVNTKMVQITKETFDKDENIKSAFDIFGINHTIIKYIEIDYNTEEIETLKYIYHNINLKEKEMLILGSHRQLFWLYGIFGYKDRENLETSCKKENIEKWNKKEEYEYFLIFYKSRDYKKYKEDIVYHNIVFENENGCIIKQ